MSLSQTQISQLYVSIFGRASEGSGNSYWQSTYNNMSSAANAMLETSAAKDYFGATLNDNQAFIEFIYENTLNKTIEDDPVGVAYWVNQLDNGWSKGNVVASMIDAVNTYGPDGINYNESDTKTVQAYIQFTNRVDISNYFSNMVEETPDDWQTSTSFNHDLYVTYEQNSVDTCKYQIDTTFFINEVDEVGDDIVFEGLYYGSFNGDYNGYISFNVESGFTYKEDSTESDGYISGHWIGYDLEEGASFDGWYNNITGEMYAESDDAANAIFYGYFINNSEFEGYWNSDLGTDGTLSLELVGTNSTDSYDYLENIIMG